MRVIITKGDLTANDRSNILLMLLGSWYHHSAQTHSISITSQAVLRDRSCMALEVPSTVFMGSPWSRIDYSGLWEALSQADQAKRYSS